MIENQSDFISGLQNAARENPVSAALVGMGLVWMLTGGNRITAAAALMAPAARAAADGIGNVVETAKSVASSVGESARELGAQAAEQVQDATATVGDSMGDLASGAHNVKKRGLPLPAERTTAATVQSAVNPIISSLRDTFERQPLLLGAIGIAIGTAMAAALPVTRIETDVVGEAADRVTAQVKEMAGAAVGQVKDAGARTFKAVKEEAAAQGLTTEAAKAGVASIGDKVVSVASTVGRRGGKPT